MRESSEPRWFVSKSSGGPTRLRLLCLPYAGGSASVFKGWEHHLPAGTAVMAVQLPGRADRWREEPLTDLEVIADTLCELFQVHVDEPFAVFGHSMGALIALVLARKLSRKHGREPVRLFFASCNAPLPERPLPALGRLDDAGLRAQLSALGLPDEVLADEELMEITLPLVRADLHVADAYLDRSPERLHCPVTAFHGADDPLVSGQDMAQWARTTRGPFTLRSVPGAHVFDRRGWSHVLKTINADLETHMRRAAQEQPRP
ncbi:thioesterase II family protein [Streptomyces lavendofoliae]|uniref:thioesterase II family protein n=1 Tax=Streptomyces lavendofoliae TaxID=67314 RepID=UPI00300F1DB6